MRPAELTRAVWDLREEDVPLDGPIEDTARALLRYAILAPSSHNSQPWRFAVDGDRIEVSADETRWLSVADPDRRELHLSIGCAIENLCVAADHVGVGHEIEYHDAGDPIATVELDPDGGRRGDHPPGLFEAITARSTSHEPFEDAPVSPSTVSRLRASVFEADVSLSLIEDDGRKQTIADLQARADRTRMADPDYRRELGHWIGIGALGDPWPVARIAQAAVRSLDLGDREARKNSRRLRAAPLLGLLVTPTDERSARVRAGQVYERLALTGCAEGLATHPMSQILELPDERDELADRVGIEDGRPQHLFRLGSADETPTHTPRWPLEAVLSDGS